MYAGLDGAPAPACDDARVRRGPCPLATTRSAAVLLLAVSSLLSACTGGAAPESACGPIVREPLDPAFVVHVVGDGTGIAYGSDPPTSGPHQPGPDLSGFLDEPLSRPRQVGVLEHGGVLIQHREPLSTAETTALSALARPGVAIAPNPDLPAPVVATAWTFKRTCDRLDPSALEEFVRQRAGKGPEG